jgi:iron complex outermembrane recepter protein
LPPGGETQSTFRQNKINQFDARFATELDGPFNFIIGGQIAWFNLTRETNTGLDSDGVNLGRAPNPRGSLNQNTGWTAGEEDNRFYGLYLNAFWDVSESLALTASVRYDKENKKQQNFVGCDPPAPGENIIAGTLFCDNALVQNVLLPTFVRRPGAQRSASFDQIQPRVSIRYSINESASVYAAYAIGFKTGGFNPFGTRALLTAFNPATTVGDIFPKEKAQTYEIGAKMEFLDRRLRVNVSGFLTKTDNAQLLEFRPEATLEAISTADKLDMYGFEMDVNAIINEYITISGGFGYLDTEIKEFTGAPTNVGGKRPQTSDITANLAFTGRVPIKDEFELVGRFDWIYQGRTFWDWANTSLSSRDPFSLFNLRVSVGNDKWEVAGWAKNLFDKRYNAENIPILPGLVDALYRAPPRTFGAEIRYRF